MLVERTGPEKNVFLMGVPVRFMYKNHRGETSERLVIPLQLRFGDAGGYYRDEWILECFDCHKKDYRSFALSCIITEL